uniref:Uncharacterized protein n=1 Tax=Anopheles epiroticus TaxID=199890 RepID=A0A182P848_9DIPT
NLGRIRADNCGQEELAKCARPFQVIQSTTDLSIATKREDLDKICPDLNAGLQCIRSYTRRCMTLEQRNRFNKLYNGTHQFVRDLCREGDYQEEFLRHAPCLQKVRPDYEVCGRRYHHTVTLITQQSQQHEGHQHGQHHHAHEQAGMESRKHQHERRHHNHHTASRTDEDDVKTVCCSFMEYLDCSEAAARNTCGHKTASFTRGFLDKMSSSLIKVCILWWCQLVCHGYMSLTRSTTLSLSLSDVLRRLLQIKQMSIDVHFFVREQLESIAQLSAAAASHDRQLHQQLDVDLVDVSIGCFATVTIILA